MPAYTHHIDDVTTNPGTYEAAFLVRHEHKWVTLSCLDGLFDRTCYDLVRVSFDLYSFDDKQGPQLAKASVPGWFTVMEHQGEILPDTRIDGWDGNNEDLYVTLHGVVYVMEKKTRAIHTAAVVPRGLLLDDDAVGECLSMSSWISYKRAAKMQLYVPDMSAVGREHSGPDQRHHGRQFVDVLSDRDKMLRRDYFLLDKSGELVFNPAFTAETPAKVDCEDESYRKTFGFPSSLPSE